MGNKKKTNSTFKSFKIKTRYIYTENGKEKKTNKTEIQDALEKILKTVQREERHEGAYTHSLAFNQLFGEKASEVTGEQRLLKITNPKTKKSVWRIWHGITTDELGFGIETKGIIYLDSDAKLILTGNAEDSDNDEPIELKFSKVGILNYYLHCNDKFNKSAYTIALVSFLIGILSLLTSIIGLIK